MRAAASSSAVPPISPIRTIPEEQLVHTRKFLFLFLNINTHMESDKVVGFMKEMTTDKPMPIVCKS